METDFGKLAQIAGRALKRLGWFTIAIPILAAMLGFFLSFMVEKKYLSSQTISLKDQDTFNSLLENVVAPVTSKVTAASAKTLLEGSPVLNKIGREAGLITDRTSEGGKLQIEGNLRKNFKVVQGGSESAVFTFSFVAKDPLVAQRVVIAMSKAFLNEALDIRRKTAMLALEFLKRQLESTSERLEKTRKEMTDYKKKHFYSMPEFYPEGTHSLMSIREQLTENRAKLEEVEHRITLIRQSYKDADPELNALNQKLAANRAELEQAQAEFTDNHPRVKSLFWRKRQLDVLVAEHARMRAAAKDTAMPGVDPSKLNVSLGADGKPRFGLGPDASAFDLFILGRQMQEQELLLQKELFQSKITQYDSLLKGLEVDLEQIPEIERKLDTYTTELTSLQKSYSEISKKYQDAKHSVELTQMDAESDLSILSPANLPQLPFFPVRRQFFMIGFFLGLAVVIGLAALLEMVKSRIRTREDVESLLGIRYLGTIPDLSAGKDAA